MFQLMRTTLIRFGSFELKSYYGSSFSTRGFASKAPLNPSLRINDNMMLQKSPSAAVETSSADAQAASRPLVLLISWLAAKQRHVDTFSRVYLDRKCDVLHVTIKPMQLLLPKSGSQVMAQRVVDFFQLEENRERPIFVHAFSVGGYLYAEILQKMMASEKTRGEATDRVIGQIYDSVVDVDKSALGFSNALFPKYKLVQKSVERTIDAYLAMMYRPATQHYEKASRLFYHNPVNAPSLFFYSYADPIGNATAIEKCVKSLRTKMGYSNIYTKSFQNSKHVCHMHTHKEEYTNTWLSFLREVPYFDDEVNLSGNMELQGKAIKL